MLSPSPELVMFRRGKDKLLHRATHQSGFTNNNKCTLKSDAHVGYAQKMATVKVPLIMRSSTAFLQTVVVLIGIGALALMLWEPHLEGRNTHATVFEVYFN